MTLDGIECVALLVVAAFAVYMAVVVPRRKQFELLEASIRELSRRIRALEHEKPPAASVPTAATIPPPEPAAVPAAPVTPPAETAPKSPTSEWIELRKPTSDEPPPLPVPVETSPPPRVAPRPVAARPELSMEAFLGGRVMLVVGVVVVLFGVAFFLKYAIDHGWIGPAARVAMGAAAGAATLYGGAVARRRGYDLFGQALMGCGLGALYLSNFYACAQYRLIDRPVGFAFAALLTAVGAGLAVRQSAPVLAYLGFLGGYLAPALLGDGHGKLFGLTGWLLLLDAGVFVVLWRRAWRGLDVLGLVFIAWYVGLWLARYTGDSPIEKCQCIGALVAASLAKGLVPSMLRRAPPPALSMLGVAGASALGVAAWHGLLAPGGLVAVGAISLALAAAFAGAAWFFGARVTGARVESESLYALAAAALITAVVEMASGEVVAPALSIVGVAILYAGVRGRHGVLVAAGLASVGLAFVDLVSNRLPLFNETMTPVFNRRFVLFETPCVALVVASSVMRRAKTSLGPLPTLVAAAGFWIFAVVLGNSIRADLTHGGTAAALHDTVPIIVVSAYALAVSLLALRDDPLGRVLALAPLAMAFLGALVLVVLRNNLVRVPFADAFFAAGVAPCVAALVAARQPEAWLRATLRSVAIAWLFVFVTADLYAWGEHGTLLDLTREEVQFRAQVGVSVAWAVYAASLVGAGFWRKSPPLRWTGLSVFALTLAKVFLVDMAQLDAVYRIGSFLVLGALLVAASFLYQRSRVEAPRDG